MSQLPNCPNVIQKCNILKILLLLVCPEILTEVESWQELKKFVAAGMQMEINSYDGIQSL